MTADCLRFAHPAEATRRPEAQSPRILCSMLLSALRVDPSANYSAGMPDESGPLTAGEELEVQAGEEHSLADTLRSKAHVAVKKKKRGQA